MKQDGSFAENLFIQWQGTSPAENATGAIVEHEDENETIDESTEASEVTDKTLPAIEETDDIQGRDPFTVADYTSERPQERPESLDRNKLLNDDLVDDFYNSLAEIEEQAKSGQLTTVTVNLPTTIDAADIFDTGSTTTAEEYDSEKVRIISLLLRLISFKIPPRSQAIMI
ncbi:uncharacterized protein CEXT_335981 [Caerostris extrusa]|uniref:Uncharacterized protein n=1 Tax=Caerostris extrusa TaxID=172846 RepID=A0AAV4TYR8_CAEEX|nr:uncharacterized protein CEXT_335981 [Caerostris extrusa]